MCMKAQGQIKKKNKKWPDNNYKKVINITKGRRFTRRRGEYTY